MEIKKLESVDFSVKLLEEGDTSINLKWKNGQLYLSISGILLGVGDSFYEIAIKDIKNIEIIDNKPLKLRLTLTDANVTITGRSDERLMAMRHFLLPFVTASG